MDPEMTSILSVMAEMNSFSAPDDKLTELAKRFEDDELSEDDLSMVSAAYRPMPFSELLKKKEKEL